MTIQNARGRTGRLQQRFFASDVSYGRGVDASCDGAPDAALIMRKLWRKVRRSATASEPTASCFDMHFKSASYSLERERRRSKSESFSVLGDGGDDCVDGRVYVRCDA